MVSRSSQNLTYLSDSSIQIGIHKYLKITNSSICFAKYSLINDHFDLRPIRS